MINKLTEALFNNQLPADLTASQRLNRQLLDLVAQLEQRVAELEDKAGSGRSSRNSSKPPSQDSPEQRAKREKKPKSPRKQGTHQGHQRVRVDLSATDEQVHYYPDTQCTSGAACDLANEPYQRHQVFDLPEVRSQVTEHCLHDAICPRCRKRQLARLPDTVPRGQMGLGLISWITLMIERCLSQFFHCLNTTNYGINPTPRPSPTLQSCKLHAISLYTLSSIVLLIGMAQALPQHDWSTQ